MVLLSPSSTPHRCPPSSARAQPPHYNRIQRPASSSRPLSFPLAASGWPCPLVCRPAPACHASLVTLPHRHATYSLDALDARAPRPSRTAAPVNPQCPGGLSRPSVIGLRPLAEKAARCFARSSPNANAAAAIAAACGGSNRFAPCECTATPTRPLLVASSALLLELSLKRIAIDLSLPPPASGP